MLLALGTWQVQRLAWKQELLATINARVASEPVPIGEIEQALSEGADIRYRPVTANGVFDHDQEQHFFATHKGASGYHVYTPFTLEDGRSIFVNRGFVPFDLKQSSERSEGLIEGTQSVTGLSRVRLDKKPSWIVPENDLQKNVYYWKDMAAMTSRSGLETPQVVQFFIDQNERSNPGGWPIGGVTRIQLPNNHLQYAITWYGLAFALVVVSGFFIRRRYYG